MDPLSPLCHPKTEAGAACSLDLLFQPALAAILPRPFLEQHNIQDM